MFTCHDMTGLISQAQDTTLPRGTRWKMKLHFTLCVWCRRYRKQLRVLRRTLLVLTAKEPDLLNEKLPADAKERLKEALKKAE
jgi:hypothetical protein